MDKQQNYNQQRQHITDNREIKRLLLEKLGTKFDDTETKELMALIRQYSKNEREVLNLRIKNLVAEKRKLRNLFN